MEHYGQRGTNIKIEIAVLLILTLCSSIASNAQIITTVAGGATGHGGYWGDGGLATIAQLERAASVAVNNCGEIYIGDKSRVLKVDPATGIITTIAGTGMYGFSGDGIAATASQLNWATLITLDTLGNLYIGDANNYRIRKVDATTGIISTFVGDGTLGSTGDGGPATAAQITPGDIAWDKFGNFYMGDLRKVRKVSPSGTISTIAGTGLPGVTGEGVLATSTSIGIPAGIATDRYGNIYFSDSTGAVRKITVSTGIITHVAGTADNLRTPYSGDGILATTCHISPVGLHVDDTGNLYICDEVNERALKVDTFGIIRTIAGTGIGGFSGDGGPATAAKMYLPQYIKMDACGSLYIADYANLRIRKVTYPSVHITPIIMISSVTTASLGSSVTVFASLVNAGCNYTIHWSSDGVEFSTTATPSVSFIKSAGIDTITAKIVPNGLSCRDSAVSNMIRVLPPGSEGVSTVNYGSFGIVPNPVRTKMMILNLNNGELTIVNTLGQVMLHREIRNSKEIVSVEGWPVGIYLVRVVDEEGNSSVTRLIKE